MGMDTETAVDLACVATLALFALASVLGIWLYERMEAHAREHAAPQPLAEVAPIAPIVAVGTRLPSHSAVRLAMHQGGAHEVRVHLALASMASDGGRAQPEWRPGDRPAPNPYADPPVKAPRVAMASPSKVQAIVRRVLMPGNLPAPRLSEARPLDPAEMRALEITGAEREPVMPTEWLAALVWQRVELAMEATHDQYAGVYQAIPASVWFGSYFKPVIRGLGLQWEAINEGQVAVLVASAKDGEQLPAVRVRFQRVPRAICDDLSEASEAGE